MLTGEVVRQLIAQVPCRQGQRAMEIAQRHGGTHLARLPSAGPDEDWDVLLMNVSNAGLERLVAELGAIDELRLTFAPHGVVSLAPPESEAPDQVVDVTVRSPIEILIGGLQSIGSWTGFLAYAAAAGVVVWIGLFTNTIYLLTAAMLIAPFAGPAMNLALGTARGDRAIVGRSLLRYTASICVCITVAALLSLLAGQEVATETMIDRSLVSSVAFLLPIVAGAAGALNLCQSERSSLVSGAATGMLVAASLAPPAGVVGMAAVLGEWGMVQSTAFVLVLQLVGINLAGSVVFALHGVSPRGARFPRGRRAIRHASWLATAAAFAGLLTLQFWSQPELQRSSRAQRIRAVVQEQVEATGVARLVTASLRFTRGATIPGQETLLVELFVQRSDAAGASREALARQVEEAVQRRIMAEGFDVTPLVAVVVLAPPGGP